METSSEVKIVVKSVFQFANDKVEELTDYIIKSDLVYAVCEGPDDYEFLSKSYEP